MLTVISPAKRLDWSPTDLDSATEPRFQKDAAALARVARKLSSADLRRLMGISEDLADLNVKRFKAFKTAPGDDLVKPAALAFGGALIGFALPLASAITHSMSLIDCALWGAVALVVQALTFVLLRVVVSDLPKRIEQGELASATLVAASAIAVGLINSACMSY